MTQPNPRALALIRTARALQPAFQSNLTTNELRRARASLWPLLEALEAELASCMVGRRKQSQPKPKAHP